ncbi:hypothetical protein OsJ_30411 [Oryza sativa Japonica Group]|uniref:Uncharacterized protein n=1 Tax=Oryza sativa subsp. japonica TaxID=39947 RepID=A3C1P3_ORYSJ|nr:hypothetical protein OsJ_30411 [Oryza sativa Japonica Group]
MEVGKPIKDSSLRPPAHGRDVHKKSRRGRPPPWALLDKTAYFADICNATSKTREGHEIPRMTLPLLASWVSLTFGVASCLSMCFMTNLRQATSHCLHESGIGIDEGNASDVRDIAIDLEGCINYVEFEFKGLPHPQRDTLLMAGRPLNGVGCWRMDCRLRSSQISHHMMPTLPNYDTARRPQPSLQKLHVGHPVLSLHDAHLVHLMAKINR